jgi:ligand-binding SRPBCC domain-containing protein
LVTWQAKHLFKNRTLTIVISEMDAHDFFEDVMIEGAFKSMQHKHFFEQKEHGTLMTDEFTFELPYGIAGKIMSLLFLTAYMRKLLQRRNIMIKEFAETEKWKSVLPIQ